MKSQVMSDNPGWHGAGIPSLKTLLLDRVVSVFRLLIHREWHRAFYLGIASMADTWNFYVSPLRTRVTCPCCGWEGRAFISTSNWRAVSFQSKCPNCDARSRHRGLYKVLHNVIHEIPGGEILVFAPELVILQLLKKVLPKNSVKTTDYNSVDVDFPNEDIQVLSFPDQSYSLVICNHVLEHIPDDDLALAECARILQAGGVAIFTIPGDFRKLTTRHFDHPDSNGHYRHYGMEIVDQMKRHFRAVEALDMSQVAEPNWRVRSYDYAFLCSK